MLEFGKGFSFFEQVFSEDSFAAFFTHPRAKLQHLHVHSPTRACFTSVVEIVMKNDLKLRTVCAVSKEEDYDPTDFFTLFISSQVEMEAYFLQFRIGHGIGSEERIILTKSFLLESILNPFRLALLAVAIATSARTREKN